MTDERTPATPGDVARRLEPDSEHYARPAEAAGRSLEEAVDHFTSGRTGDAANVVDAATVLERALHEQLDEAAQ